MAELRRAARSCSPRWTATAPRPGFDLALTRAVADAVAVPVIASGGVGTLDHLVAGVREGHATAVLAASIFHFGIFTIAQVKAHMRAAGLPVRLERIPARARDPAEPVAPDRRRRAPA